MGRLGDQHPVQRAGYLHEVAREVEAAGGAALAIRLDVRDESAIAAAVEQAAAHFGGIDILVNNASAIQMTNTQETPAKRFDLMFGVNVRATFLCSQACLPFLAKSANPHILNPAPPLSMNLRWFRDHVAYTMSKYGMSMCTLGMAEEFRGQGIAVNSLWPRTTIATAAIAVNFPQAILDASRKPDIMADAACAIFKRDSRTATGNFYIDEDVLRAEGVTELESYAVNPGARLYTDLFLD
ncbi:MAG: SDR family oxidoreductase [Burkholderiales bacterium]